jgi:hypothetical protein
MAPAAAFAHTKCPEDIAPITYHLTRSGRIEIAALIDGSGPYNFIVYTGQQITIIEPSLAVELDLQSETSVPIISGINMDRAEIVWPQSIAIGPHVVRRPIVGVMRLTQMQASEPDIRGILGENILMRFDLLLELGHKVLYLDEAHLIQKGITGERIPIIPSSDFPDSPCISCNSRAKIRRPKRRPSCQVARSTLERSLRRPQPESPR